MVVKDNDLVVGTYGRSFWILDDLSPLRQMTSDLPSAYLFAPGDATRVRRNVNQDTPMPPEVPHSLNAPPGALIYYYLGAKPTANVTLEITDSAGHLVRTFSSAPIPPEKESLQPIPDFWKEVAKPMPTTVGTNRINWDLRYENPPANSHGYDISATPFLTPPTPWGPLALPGVYTLTLNVDGRKLVQKLMVRNDPRSPGSSADLRRQHELQMALYEGDKQAFAAVKALGEFRSRIEAIPTSKLPKEVTDAISKLSDKLDNLSDLTVRKQSFGSIQGQTINYLAKMEFGDIGPGQPVHDAVTSLVKDLHTMVKAWNEIQDKDVKALNEKLKKAGVPAVEAGAKL
jgi:hypothetical protein